MKSRFQMSSMGELTFFLGYRKKSWCDEFEALMKSRFQMSSMGELTFFLGYRKQMTASTPIETQKPLVKDEEASNVDVHLYRSMIGSLMYLTASRPDIMFAVCACSRFQVTPKSSHLSVVKRIFRYLKGKPKLGLWYPRVSSFDLESYSDSDYAGANLDRKSTTGGSSLGFKESLGRALDGTEALMLPKLFMLSTVDPQSDPSPRPSPSTIIPDFILESSGGNHRGQSSSDKSLSGNEGDMTLQSVYDLCISLYTQSMDEECLIEAKIGRKNILKEKLDAKGVYTLDNIETDDAQDVGRTRDVVLEQNPKLVSTRRKIVPIEYEGTDDQTEGGRATQTTQTTQTPTSTIFGDDETIAQVLLNMSQAKAVSREKEKGVEFKDIEETERPRPTSTRSLLTLKPLPKIDPKDKGKKKIEEEDESESESDGIPEAEKKFKQLASDEEMARKVQEEWEGKEERKRLAEEEATNNALIRIYDDIKARIEADRLLAKKLQEEERDQFTIEERAKFLHDTIAAQRKFLAQQRLEAIRNRPPTKNQLRNQMMTYLKHIVNKGEESFISRLNKVSSPMEIILFIYRANRISGIQLSHGEEYPPLSKDLLQRMLDLGLEVERESSFALDLIRFIKQQIDKE
ncbi:hypothetical protein Tco_1024813 [Tanacetum coccineum]